MENKLRRAAPLERNRQGAKTQRRHGNLGVFAPLRFRKFSLALRANALQASVSPWCISSRFGRHCLHD